MCWCVHWVSAICFQSACNLCIYLYTSQFDQTQLFNTCQKLVSSGKIMSSIAHSWCASWSGLGRWDDAPTFLSTVMVLALDDCRLSYFLSRLLRTAPASSERQGNGRLKKILGCRSAGSLSWPRWSEPASSLQEPLSSDDIHSADRMDAARVLSAGVIVVEARTACSLRCNFYSSENVTRSSDLWKSK